MSALFAARFEPATVAEANAIAVVRVLRWGLMVLAVAAALAIATGYCCYRAGQQYRSWLAAEMADEPVEIAGLLMPAAEPTIEQLAQWSAELPIEWPSPAAGLAEAMAATDAAIADMRRASLAGLTVAQLRSEAQRRGLSIRQDGRVLRKAELIEALA
jgi:hypothetical protein